MAYSIFRSNAFVLEAVEILKEIATLTSKVSAADDENERASLTR